MRDARDDGERCGTAVRYDVRIRGIVQGVGFRPFVHRLAEHHAVAGWVRNFPGGVRLQVEGEADRVEGFIEDIRRHAPLSATIDSMEVVTLEPAGMRGFVIEPSELVAHGAIQVPPDVALCSECESEVLDPHNRRFQHPFANCTYCGPRFTILRSVPYDRPNTSMSAFRMCRECEAEYGDIVDRRYHAQPNSCPRCGPRLWFEGRTTRDEAGQALRAASQVIRDGGIVAIRGLGGFHLACDASDDGAVERLRRRKAREAKPMAVMVRDLVVARTLCDIPPEAEVLLTGAERPIVLLPRRPGAPISHQLAPDTDLVGVMLPYTPVHMLLLRECGLGALVITSGNLSDEPLATRNEEARARLGGIADAFLLHDRDIVVPCDDSVVRWTRLGALMVRRARGYVPRPIRLAEPVRPCLGTGGHLKSTFCLACDDQAFLSQHLGDLEDPRSLEHYEWALRHLREILRIDPQVIACDMHPGYAATAMARRMAESQGVRLVEVQHHHAHVASCMAEHGIECPVIGLACDGSGWGTDGTVWGLEALVVGPDGFERVGHLAPVPLPGGEAAVREPWRMALTYLWLASEEGMPWPEGLPVVVRHQDEWPVLLQMVRGGLNSPMASSAGRLFDAVSALLDLGDVNAYEGQGAMKLEAAASPQWTGYPWALRASSPLIVDPLPMIGRIADDVTSGVARDVIAGRFHNTVADMLGALAKGVSSERGIEWVALSGGSFQNALLLEAVVARLRADGLRPLVHRQVPCNDGGLSLGQAVVAGMG
ncbi:MAG TPA: carbamoyltransferase HypF [Armatimonadota bacterium]|nr:carbamoyltransferase HypF [Armatimonadota bacterium]